MSCLLTSTLPSSSQGRFVLGFNPPSPIPTTAGSLKLKFPSLTPSNIRLRNGIKLLVRDKSVTLYASNSNPSAGDDVKEETKSSSSTGGPPFLTILAGLVVFLLVSWGAGSIITWFFSLLVSLFPSK